MPELVGFFNAKAIATGEIGLLTVAVVFLPIADRELRVTARKRSTFWVRVAGAAFAVAVGAAIFGIAAIARGPAAAMGQNLFAVVTWLCFAAALLAGLFFTADSLSEEKREGTLGFLFLTSLRGYDVVIGKLLAGGVRGFYTLLAVLPVLAVTLLMGGVTGWGFFKTSLALLNALLVSLAAGLFVSAISRDSHKALAGTIATLGIWIAAGPTVDGLIAMTMKQSFEPLLSISSPGYVFVGANQIGQTSFGWALLANQVLVWTLISLSGVFVRRTWQDKPAATVRRRRRFASARWRAGLRHKLIDVNPVLWLASLDRWPAVALWLATIVMAGGVAATFIPGQRFVWLLWSYLGGAFSLIIYVFICSQAARFFVEARRSGVLELLLATPLTGRQIVHGQWRALVRMFAAPLALFLIAHGVSSFMSYDQMWQMLGAATAAPPVPPTATNAVVVTNIVVGAPTTPGTNTTPWPVAPAPAPLTRLLAGGISTAGTIAALMNVLALVWFAMWMGLTSQNMSLAILKTMFWVEILPWFAISFLTSALVGLLFIPAGFGKNPARAAQMMVWFPIVSAGFGILLSIGKDVFFYLWARRKLNNQFRVQVSAPIGQSLPVVAKPAPATFGTPIRARGNQ